VTVPSGQSSAVVTVEIAGNTIPQPNFGFTVTLSNPVNAVLDPVNYLAVGTIINDDFTVPPQMVFLEWSDDRGHTWGNPVGISGGAIGQYGTSLQWQRLGMARDRVFRISWSGSSAACLQGAWIDSAPAIS
jgi:hypothetical protein